ncbi:expressed unknown protein [Seminavis robusta]|uniref:DUF1794 domain-containing protein n=1 Tax=Seminavis robusta TaxID=568900 RepID=A0A9N8EZ28_9STRA|nr:expressed unknown protein [Seminavis robusta]|eukprot:Sro2173_g317590.1 n/a (340) ;mRNA; r:9374-10393
MVSNKDDPGPRSFQLTPPISTTGTRRSLLSGLVSSVPFFGSRVNAETSVPTQQKNGLGPLADLVGTWTGEQGINIVAVPSRRSNPSDFGKFELIVRPYRETLTITPIEGPVRNRGGNLDQFVGAVAYEQTVTATDHHPETIHVENGMLFYLEDIQNYSDGSPVLTKEETPLYSVARSASIPHGNSALLLGTHRKYRGPPSIHYISALPPNIGSKAPPEFVRPYYRPLNIANPNEYLQRAVSAQTILETTQFSMDSRNSGIVSNVPFLTSRADTTGFQCDFWLERVQQQDTAARKSSLQLQYSQVIDIDFHKPIVSSPDEDDGSLIRWPHVTVNTLVKQE